MFLFTFQEHTNLFKSALEPFMMRTIQVNPVAHFTRKKNCHSRDDLQPQAMENLSLFHAPHLAITDYAPVEWSHMGVEIKPVKHFMKLFF
jgi:hypothetical protein